MTSASGGLATLTTPPGGGTGAGVALPISGTGSIGSLDLTSPLGAVAPNGAAAVAQVIPVNLTLNAFSARGTLVSNVGFFGTGSGLTIKAQLYTAPGDGSTPFVAVPSATCTLSPPYNTIAVAGTTGECRVSGLNVSLVAGRIAVVVFSATSTSSVVPPATTVTALSELLSAGLTLS